ncbi:MAG: 3-hydroxyacyl-CoA dehydrogenase family protein [Candidatus Dormibacteraeota bacterium]|nr:3-hydroxyacyl-CoA dehydrogenase family protein [Candidatus Dormibacteraeota bacterium]MBV9524374.1 3-hydroxyacyl-CoA dehydrogenase family protein [Candidatus Dormibacteraeota bacterium]
MVDARRLSVVGAGAMGGQIAYQAALHGFDVHLVSRRQERLESAREESSRLLRRRVEKGKLDGDECEAAIERVRLSTELAEMAGAGVVIESVAEDRDTKREIFERISQHADEDAIIGTNSSTLPSSMFEDVVANPSRLLNVHFFNPPLMMALVEVVRGAHTSEDAVTRAMAFAREIGKTPVLVEKEAFGFIANRILFIALQEAMKLAQDGYVSIEECDIAVHNALGWPLGPFELSDLVGLDVVEAILTEGYKQTGDERWKPLPILQEHVAKGELGRKTGSGFRQS